MADENASERIRVVTWDDPLEAMMEARKVSGTEFFEKVRMGELPAPPYARLLGMDAFDQGEGQFTMTLVPREFHYNPIHYNPGLRPQGIPSTLLDSVMSAAVHTMLEAGQGYLAEHHREFC